MMNLELHSISDVKQLILILEKQGFSDQLIANDLIRSKLKYLIKKTNKFSIAIDPNELCGKLSLHKIDAFADIEKVKTTVL